jgi:hypothetical protein
LKKITIKIAQKVITFKGKKYFSEEILSSKVVISLLFSISKEKSQIFITKYFAKKKMTVSIKEKK